MVSGLALSAAVALAMLASPASAHGYLEEPKPSWTDGKANPDWVVLIDNYWDIGSGGDQCGLFKTMAAEKKMTVRDVVLDMVKDKKCGNTDDSASPQPIPSDGKAKWLGNGGGGFTHVGPCEIYLDDKMVLHSDNCQEDYPGGDVGSTQTSDMPVDYSSCNGKCTLSIYWLAFQNAQWQAYINCVPLSGSGSSTQTQSTAGTSTSKEQTSTKQGSANAPVTETPSTEQQSTQAPSSEKQTTQSPSSKQQSTQAPSSEQQATQAPSNQWTPSPQTQAPSSQLTQAPPTQQWTQAPSTQQQWTQAPSTQQKWTQAPSTEQRSMDFNSLNGGTGTVQPPANLRK